MPNIDKSILRKINVENTYENNLCIKSTEDFDVVMTTITTTRTEIRIVTPIETGLGLLEINKDIFKSYLRRYINGRPAKDMNSHVKKWFDMLGMDAVKRISANLDKAEAEILDEPCAENLLPNTSAVMNFGFRQISKESLDHIRNNLSYYHATEFYCGEENEEIGYIMPVPEGIGRMPDDTARCFLFADRFFAEFIAFRPDGPIYENICTDSNGGSVVLT